jgi:hypothetical protein
MFKAIAYISATLLITGVVTISSKSQLAVAQSTGSTASSSSSSTTAPG